MKLDPLDYLAYLLGLLLAGLYLRGIITGGEISDKAVMPLATALGAIVTAIVNRNKDRKDKEKDDKDSKKGDKDAPSD